MPLVVKAPALHSLLPRKIERRFLGPVRVRIALADSLNVPAVRTLERVGVGAFLARLRSDAC